MSTTKMETKETAEMAQTSPVVLDFGRQKAKSVKQLRKGKGKLVDEITSTIEELKVAGTIAASAQPVIVVVREKRSGKGVLSMLKV